jgi:hypothetical protein
MPRCQRNRANPNVLDPFDTRTHLEVSLRPARVTGYLTAGDYSEEIVGVGRRYWNRAAEEVAKRLSR